MVMVIVNWLYIAATTFFAGYGTLSLLGKLLGYKVRHVISYFLAGLTVVTVYAQFFSLFAGVSVAANVILVVTCASVVFFCRRSLYDLCTEQKNRFLTEKWRMPVYALLVLLFAYGTSRGYMHFDTGLYHAQSIRWIEEYGAVKGLANLQLRFGYNSSALVLTALYSMKELMGQSLHTTAGFFALIASVCALDLYKVFSGKRICLSDFARMGLVFYLGVIFSQMMSPATDYYAQLLVFMILILWLEEDEYQKREGLENPIPYGLLCVLCVYAASVKFSVALLLLLVIKPAALLLKRKAGKQITIFLMCGILTILPFFIRNFIISGWLIYPFAGIDLFSVDWKVPIGQVQFDAKEIGFYGRGITDASKADTPIELWLGPWFAALKILEKLFVLMTVAAFVAAVVYLVVSLLGSLKKSKQKENRVFFWSKEWDFWLVFAVYALSTVFWFVSAPLVRYGYAYITVIPLITFGHLFLRLLKRIREERIGKYVYVFFCVALAGFLLSRVKGLAEDILRTWKQPYYIVQTDYVDGEAKTKVVDGTVFYVPTESGQIGYNKFPSSMFLKPVELRGESIEDGFRQILEE